MFMYASSKSIYKTYPVLLTQDLFFIQLSSSYVAGFNKSATD